MSVANINAEEWTQCYHLHCQTYHGRRWVQIYLSGKTASISWLWTITLDIYHFDQLTTSAIIIHTKSISIKCEQVEDRKQYLHKSRRFPMSEEGAFKPMESWKWFTLIMGHNFKQLHANSLLQPISLSMSQVARISHKVMVKWNVLWPQLRAY